MKKFLTFLLCAALFTSCLPKDQIELRDIRNLALERGDGAESILAGDAVFYNPNATRMKLREINVDVLIDGKKSAKVDQKLKAIARGKSEFTVPVKVKLDLKEIGLVDAIKSLFGGKKYQIQYKGYLKVNVNGIPFRVPVDHTEEFKLKF
ncbi:MAG: LEA type 2 family protein [Bacteroidota bacterium]